MPAAFTSSPPTFDELRKNMLDNLPSWLCEPEEVFDAVLHAIAAQFEEVGAAAHTLYQRTFIALADGTWLDAHGAERSKSRQEGESDLAYRQRIIQFDDALTPVAIKAAVDAVLEVGSSSIEDCQADDLSTIPEGAVTLASLGYTGKGNSFNGRRCFRILILDQNAGAGNTAFTSEDGTLDINRVFSWDQAEGGPAPQPGAYTADLQGPADNEVYPRVIEAIERIRPAGVSYQVFIV